MDVNPWMSERDCNYEDPCFDEFEDAPEESEEKI